MVYTCRYLQFGDMSKPNGEAEEVPGFNEILCADQQVIPPIYKKIIDSAGDIWTLRFVSCSGKFYNAQSINSISHQSGDVVNAWYKKPGNGPTVLRVTPFLVREDGTEVFLAPNPGWLTFDEPGSAGNSIATNNLSKAEVTATVKTNLPECDEHDMYGSFSKGYIDHTVRKVVFREIFPYIYDTGQVTINGNLVTVNKNHTCFALAVYKQEISSWKEGLPETEAYVPREFEGDLVKDYLEWIIKHGPSSRNPLEWVIDNPRLLLKMNKEQLVKIHENITARIEEMKRTQETVKKQIENLD
jgi:hypothetical protein